VQGDPHLPAGGKDVDGSVIVEIYERAVEGRGLGQLLDFVAQR